MSTSTRFGVSSIVLLLIQALLLDLDGMDDPFIPQRGRRMSSTIQQNPMPLEHKRSADDERRLRDLRTLAYAIIRNSEAFNTDYMDDPFVPQRGRRSLSTDQSKTKTKLKNTDRNKRGAVQRNNDDERLRELTQFAYSLLRKSEPLITDFSNDPFIPQRGKRSIAKQKQTSKGLPSKASTRRKRSLDQHDSEEDHLRELTNFAYSLLQKSEPLINEFGNDPFIPQRGRRSPANAKSNSQQAHRDKRSEKQDEDRMRELTNLAYSLLRNSESLNTDYTDDPFVPQRGRRPSYLPSTFNIKRIPNSPDSDEKMRQLTDLAYSFLRNSDSLITDYMDDPFIPQRGRRSKTYDSNDSKKMSLKNKRKPNLQHTENERMRELQNIAYSLLRSSITDYADDPFIPQRGRRTNNNDSTKSIGKLLSIPVKRKRSVNAPSTDEHLKTNLYESQAARSSSPLTVTVATAATHMLRKPQA